MCQDRNFKNDIIPRISTGFAGGIGGTGSVCGAVAGAVMAISLFKERGNTMEDYMMLASTCEEFRRRFEKEMGSINCRDLTGMDLTVLEDMEKMMTSDVPQKVCRPAVALAHKLVTEMLK